MHYVIQENTFREENYDNLLKAVQRLGLSHEIVKVLPFTDEVEVQYKGRDVFVFGAVKLARIARERDWSPGSMLNDNHDYRVYGPAYGQHMLNADSHVFQFGRGFNWEGTGLHFIRPCLDNKAFTGRVFDYYEWAEFCATVARHPEDTTIRHDTWMQAAAVKHLQKEVRVWIVNGEPVAASQYRLGNRTVYSADVEPELIRFARARAQEFALADAFVMDVCLTGGKHKIVECGCVNSAGFYHADMQRLVMAIDDAFGAGS
jgi:hypothetical protein